MKALGLSFLAAAVTLAPLGACGGGGNSDGTDVTVPDAKVTPDAPVTPDAFVLPAGCDYYEQNDAGNDGQAMGALEMTQLTFSTSTTVCGNLNAGHFKPPMTAGGFGLVDEDVYLFDVGADTNVFITLTGTGLVETANPQFSVFNVNDDTAAASGFYKTDRASGADRFKAGTYAIIVASTSKTEVTTTSTYKLKIATDTGSPCQTNDAGAATYTEANDTATNTGNDTVKFANSATTPYVLTASPTDAPEPTMIVASSPTEAKIVGTAAGTNVDTTDVNYDTDTYEFTTGPATTQLRIRLNWPSVPGTVGGMPPPVSPDVDFYLFEKPAPGQPIGEPVSVTGASSSPEESAVVTVMPNATYWVSVGGYDSMEPNDHFPVNYQLKVCGEPLPAL